MVGCEFFFFFLKLFNNPAKEPSWFIWKCGLSIYVAEEWGGDGMEEDLEPIDARVKIQRGIT